MTPYPLGRRQADDPLDGNFPMAAALKPVGALPTYKYWWAYNVFCNQTGDTCVANAWTHFLADSPRTHRMYDLDAAHPVWGNPAMWTAAYRSDQSNQTGFRGYLYDQAQKIDEFDDTPPQGGTSVRAGAKALQNLGAIGAYHWANSFTDVILALLTTGPVVVGTTWYNSMFDPDSKGRLVCDPMSGVAGGHAWKLDGINTVTRMVRMKNSWGKGWGNGGFAEISYTDLEPLLFSADGEAVIGLEP